MPIITYEDFDTQEARRANYLIDLYEGNQIKYVEMALNGSMKGGQGARPNWRKRGYVPRTYNVVREIVEKSAMLFNKPPKYEILPASNPDAEPVVDATFNEIMSIADWQEFSINLDNYTRLLGATCVLIQRFIAADDVLTEGGIYRFSSDRGDTLVPLMLHTGNSVVVMNSTRTRILELAYITDGCIDDEDWEYRVITPTEIVDIHVDMTKPEELRETEVARASNPAGRVTANMWYDTSKPRQGVWPRISEDLISGQEMLNTHLTDMQFATSRNLDAALILKNVVVQTPGQSGPTQTIVQEKVDMQTMSWALPDDNGLDLGIGSIVSITSSKNSDGSDAYYASPEVNLTEQMEVVKSQLETLANGWSVTLKTAGDASATSGFQLVVEELDNLQLRERRAQSFQAGFRRFYENMVELYPELTAGQLQVVFAEPSLPTNKAEDLKLWTDKLNAGLASPEDFYMSTEGLSKEEAEMRAKEVASKNARVDQVPMLMTLLAKGVISTQDIVFELKRRGVLGESVSAQVAEPQVVQTPEGV